MTAGCLLGQLSFSAAEAGGDGGSTSASGPGRVARPRRNAPDLGNTRRRSASGGPADASPPAGRDPVLLQQTAELANAALSLGDGLPAVQQHVASCLGWAAAGYRIFSGDGITEEQLAQPAPEDALAVHADSTAPADGRRLVLVPVQDGARIAAVFGFRLPDGEVCVEDRDLLLQVARQLAALARRDIYRQGMLTRELEMLHQGQLAGMAEIAQSLSHELSQPLAALSAYAGALRRLLVRGDAAGAEIAYLGERLLQQVDRAGGILQATKSFVLQRSGAAGLVDVAVTVRELVQLARRELRAASVDLQLEIADGLPTVRGSEAHLAQIVLSLLANAMNALRPIAADRRRITIRVVQMGREVRIHVGDSGCHPDMNPEPEHGPFYMAYADGARIGLAISRSLAEIHGGRLWAEQEAGETSFVVALPVLH
jgi:signal transduction histidine kinase